MKIRTFGPLAAAALCALAVWYAGALAPHTALAAAPKIKPTPVALQYDEIDRMAFGQVTPPPPGVFHQDYLAIMSGVRTAAAPTSAATPAPRRHGLLGQLSQAVSSGLASDAGQGAVGSQTSYPGSSAMEEMTKGKLLRYAFYGNWVRVDDPIEQTATISKCDLHEYITLDLAHKTYTVSNTEANCAPSAPQGMGGQEGDQGRPGTGDLSISSSSKGLGPKTLDGIPTVGSDWTMQIAWTNSTGSCQNMNAGMGQVAYVSRIVKPRAYCPLPAVGDGRAANYGAVSGCKPTIHRTGGAAPDDVHLEMYLKRTFGSSPGASVLERGNVRWLYKPEAEALFSIPKDFTKQG